MTSIKNGPKHRFLLVILLKKPSRGGKSAYIQVVMIGSLLTTSESSVNWLFIQGELRIFVKYAANYSMDQHSSQQWVCKCVGPSTSVLGRRGCVCSEFHEKIANETKGGV